MAETKLLYLENMQVYESEAMVIEILEEEGGIAVILDQTIFYPQGGGQPYDTGKIIGSAGEFVVREVRNIDGVVKHYGEFSAEKFSVGEKVKLMIDVKRRVLNSKNHTAGHVVDSAIVKLGLKWTDSRGHHFPEGPYVTYENLSGVDESLKQKIEDEANRLIAEGFEVQSVFIEPQEMIKHCFPGNMNYPEGKKLRIIKVYGELGCPCGGTHVKNISEIGKIRIPKLKKEKEWTRVRYDLVV